MAAGATRTAVVTVAHWPLLAALDAHERRQESEAKAGADEAGGGVTGETRVADTDSASGTDSAGGGDSSGAADCAVLVHRHRVVDCTAAARTAGVLPGMRQRAARAICPQAVLVESDPEAERSLFELVAAAVDTVAAGVDMLRPGMLLMPAAGPARHQGGEHVLAERIIDAVAEHTGWDCSVGIADGPFAAVLAAAAGRVIRPGRSADYIAPHPIAALAHAPVSDSWSRGASQQAARSTLADAVDLLQRLGIATLGDFAALPTASVMDRFGPQIAHLHLLARGLEAAPPRICRPPQPIQVEQTLESPLTRTDQAAFVARPLAEQLHTQLVAHGLACTRLTILGRLEDGTTMERTWRHDGALSVQDVVDRIRWQCDGWITRAALGGPATGPIVQLALLPEQLVPAGEHAPALWGDAGEETQRAHRAFARAQGLAGEQAVLMPVPAGGRMLRDDIALLPWRTERPPQRSGPWPGAMPQPAPATVFRARPPLRLMDQGGEPITATVRGLLSAPPAQLEATDQPTPTLQRLGLRPGKRLPVIAHGSLVLLDERWWTAQGERAARLQLVIRAEQGDLALVALCRQGSWELEGLYD